MNRRHLLTAISVTIAGMAILPTAASATRLTTRTATSATKRYVRNAFDQPLHLSVRCGRASPTTRSVRCRVSFIRPPEFSACDGRTVVRRSTRTGRLLVRGKGTFGCDDAPAPGAPPRH